eukprot:jgi/Botrbrau1/10989/Bobra.0234s0014.1
MQSCKVQVSAKLWDTRSYHRVAFVPFQTDQITKRCRTYAEELPRNRARRVCASGTEKDGIGQPGASLSRHRVLHWGGLILSTTSAGLLVLPQVGAEEFVDDGVSAGELPTAIREASPGPPPASGVEYKDLTDRILAYSFKYPVEVGNLKLSLVMSRKPERYSSAAPLTADARQRIVAELVDFGQGVTISVTVGPPSGVLKGKSPDQWRPREVADTVLIDRSTARITTGQRVSLNFVESVDAEEKEGQVYWIYEHLSQGSPSLRSAERETYRHAWAVTSSRPAADGTPYLYTLNLSCPDDIWPTLGPAYRDAVESFKLVPPTKEFVSPEKDPWRFF